MGKNNQITEKEIFEALRQQEIENYINMTEEEIDKANLPSYKDECGKYLWFKLYLRRMETQGIKEFRLVLDQSNPRARKAMIHPLGEDGETLDFKL